MQVAMSATIDQLRTYIKVTKFTLACFFTARTLTQDITVHYWRVY